MKSRQEWIEEQERYLAAYSQIREELMQIPGVRDVEVAVKERGGRLTDELAFRVSVIEKVPESALPPNERVPAEIHGFRTDVIVVRGEIPAIGFSDEDDWKNYGTKVGGIRIGNDKDAGTGTLGCFCRRTSDGATVMLSCHHVLFNGGAANGAHVGQPDYEKSCCCVCNDIGIVVDGDPPVTAGGIDCAIATLNAGVAFYQKVRNIKRPDDTLELNGFLASSAVAVAMEEVWKVGARTGLTRGNITAVTPRVEVTPTAAFPRFANHGDSGSVIVSLASSDVVALLRSIDPGTGTLGFGTPIAAVLTRLGVTILATDASRTYDVDEFDEDGTLLLERLSRESAYHAMADRLRRSERGRELVKLFLAHRRECLHLVNHERAATVAWQRSRGPIWIAALGRSAKEPIYRIPDEIDGVTRNEAVAAMRTVLETYGSAALRDDLKEYADALMDALVRCNTVDELIDVWEGVEVAASRT